MRSRVSSQGKGHGHFHFDGGLFDDKVLLLLNSKPPALRSEQIDFSFLNSLKPIF